MSVYLYARVSTDRQENSKAAQVDRLLQWAERHGHTVDETFTDEDASALSVRLQDRPAGKQLWDRLEPADVVVATKMDRMFRRLADMANTIDAQKQLGIRLILLDTDVDISTPHGRAIAGWAAVAAQFESELHGQRKREVYAHKRASGLPYSCLRPYGWPATKDKRGKLIGWAPVPDEQALGRRVLDMRRAGRTWFQIASDLSLSGVRKPVTRRGGTGFYHVADVQCLALAAEAGYPKVAQGYWRVPGCAQKQRAATASGSRQSS